MIYTCPTFFDCIEKATALAASFGNDLKTKTTLFCEDKLTLSCETALAEKTNGFFNAEVSSFARYILKRAPESRSLSKEGGATTVKKLLSDKAGDLVALKSAASSPSLASALSELIAQLKSAKVTPEALYSCVDGCAANVGAKVRDVALIFDEYEKFLEKEGYTDSNNSLRDMPALIEKDEQMKKTRVIVVGFSSVTKQSCDVIAALFKNSLSCDFFCVTGNNKDVYTDEFLNFVKTLDPSSPAAEKSAAEEEALRLIENMYDPVSKQKTGLYSDKIAIYEANDLYDEMDFIAKRVRYEVIENGRRYNSVAVAVGNLPEYSLALKKKMKEYEIPFFFDEKRRLSEHPLIKLAVSLIRLAENRSDMMREIKKIITNAVFIPEKRVADDMIRTITVNSVTAKEFLSPDAQPFEDIYQIAKREAIRRLFADLKQSSTPNEYSFSIKRFLESAGFTDNLSALSEKLSLVGAEEERSFNDAAATEFTDLLDGMEKIIGNEKMPLSEYRKILLSGAEACEISLIPEYLDCVFVCELKDCRFKKYDVLFAAGLNGEIPFVKADTALLQDSDIGALDALSVKIEPKIKVVNKREREAVAVALASFKDQLFLTYSLSSPSGNKTTKSEIVDFIINTFSEENKRLRPFNRLSIEKARLFAEKDKKDRLDAFDYMSLRSSLFSLLKDCDDFKNGATYDVEAASSFYAALKKLNDARYLEYADSLLGKVNKKLTVTADIPPENFFPDKNVSASILETYYLCPYKNFLKYGAGVADSLSPDIRALDFGNILHGVAEEFVRMLDRITSEEEAMAAAERIFGTIVAENQYSRFSKRSDYAYSLDLVGVEVKKFCLSLYREFLHSGFKPVGMEVWFADWGQYKSLPLKTKTSGYKLFGKADRVDKYGDYVRIVDYKTGNAKEKVKDEKFYVGVNLQLYLYMNAFAVGNDKPAGAYYYAVANDYAKEDDDRFYMFGKTLSDDDVLRATDDALFEKDKSSIIDAKIKTYKSKGSVKLGNLADERTLKGYLSYAKLMAEKGVNEVIDGVIIASPYSGACDYCEYKAICRYDEETDDLTRKATGVNPETIVNAAEAENERRK
ncbi:MAG: PD-(D/E)XK nuclease family protein [Clostridia bacterium]|nr:PD-(D/E)XK nuclease family protein [Clostridia bacterium]